MRKIFQNGVSLWFILTLLLAACQTNGQNSAQSNQPANVRVVGLNLDNQDQQVGEVLVNNNNTLSWRQQFTQALAAGNKFDVFIDCDDGRVSAGSQQYAVFTSQGQQEPFRFEIGSLAGEVTPEMVAVLNQMIDRGQIRSINVSSHTCEGGTCGAQGVKAELEAGKPVSEFTDHGVGDAAQWISDNLDASTPIEQVAAQVTRVFEGTDGRVPVFGWVADHATQERELVVERYTGLPGEDVILHELEWQNQESAKVLLPQAQAQGLDKAQSFRRIVVTDSMLPVEVLVGTTPGGLDEAFNVSLIVPPGASAEQIESAMGPARAGLQYALAHATPETELIFMFEDEGLLTRMLEEAKAMQVYKDFLANTSFQEVAAYAVNSEGSIMSSYLIKPAYTAVASEYVIGPTFRNMMIHGVKTIDGVQWALIRGGDTSPFGSNWVSMNADGTFRFARIYPKLEDATFHFNALVAQDPGNPNAYSVAPFEGGGIVYSPDFGVQVLDYLRDGRWSEATAVIEQAASLLDRMCQAGYCSLDIHHLDQFLIGPDGVVRMSDWSPNTTISGDKLLARFASPSAYTLYVRRNLEDGLIIARVRYPEVGQFLPMKWPELTTSSFTFTGSSFQPSAVNATAFERAVSDLRSTSPEVVAAARNTLRGMGAVEYGGQWIIGGSQSVLASGPIRLGTLQTMYPDGARAFMGFQTKQWGVIGLERAENVTGGVAGWKMYAPRIFNSLEGKTIAGIPAGRFVSEALSKGLLLIWTGFVIDDVHDYATQTEHMATGPNTMQLFEPPIAASYALYLKPEKFPYVSTMWNISYEDLVSGCNGTGFTSRCGAYVPTNTETPILIYGALAGTTIPQNSWPSFGVEGNSILATWSYMRNDDGSFHLWHNDQSVFPGTILDYEEVVINEWGIWMVPYHAEYMTASCQGLCIQQSHGGEEFLFEKDSQPRAIDLCPTPYTDEDPCWRP